MATSDCQSGHEVGWRAEIEHFGVGVGGVENTLQALLPHLCTRARLQFSVIPFSGNRRNRESK